MCQECVRCSPEEQLGKGYKGILLCNCSVNPNIFHNKTTREYNLKRVIKRRTTKLYSSCENWIRYLPHNVCFYPLPVRLCYMLWWPFVCLQHIPHFNIYNWCPCLISPVKKAESVRTKKKKVSINPSLSTLDEWLSLRKSQFLHLKKWD